MSLRVHVHGPLDLAAVCALPLAAAPPRDAHVLVLDARGEAAPAAACGDAETALGALVAGRGAQQALVVLLAPAASQSALVRQKMTRLGAHALVESEDDVVRFLERAAKARGSEAGAKRVQCPVCDASLAGPHRLWDHHALMHVHAFARVRDTLCPLCGDDHGGRWARHLFHHFHPVDVGQRARAFSLVVVRHPHTKRFLLVHEVDGQGWWLPGGGVDPLEDLETAALRETREEANCEIRLTGVLKVMYSPHRGGFALRVVFLAEPVDSDGVTPTKMLPDGETVAACWVTLDEMQKVKLRGGEPATWFTYIENGGTVHPLSVVQ